MTETVRRSVRERAGHQCEYCQLHQNDSPLAALHIEHIRPRKHGGSDDVENLCLACIDCNLHKGPNLTGIDPTTGSITELFDPRRHRWSDHFEWSETMIVGTTAIGRTTIRVLDLNGEDRLDLRLA
jgi:5-methylcytosine-specific restriction endonuclease McrA